MKKFRLLFISVLCATLLSGCAVTRQASNYLAPLTSFFYGVVYANRTVPGSVGVITQNIDFYFAIDDNHYRDISEGLYDLFISDAKWYATDGLILQDPNLSVSPISVTWKEGDTEYKVPGVRVTVQVTVLLNEETSLGQKGVYVELPNIKLIAKAMGVQARAGTVPLQDRILVSQVNVHSMNYWLMLLIYIPMGLTVFVALKHGWNWLKSRRKP